MGICVRALRGLALSCLVLGGILVGAGSVAVVSSGAAVAQTVGSIVVEGNRRVEADTIRSYFRPGPGGRIGPEQEDEALKAMVATGLFSDVRINHSGGRIVVTVAENPVINRVAFEATKRPKTSNCRRKPNRNRAARFPARPCRPTCSASSKFITAAVASTFRSIRRSSSCLTTA